MILVFGLIGLISAFTDNVCFESSEKFGKIEIDETQMPKMCVYRLHSEENQRIRISLPGLSRSGINPTLCYKVLYSRTIVTP